MVDSTTLLCTFCSKQFYRDSDRDRHQAICYSNPNRSTIIDIFQKCIDEKCDLLNLSAILQEEKVYNEIIPFPLDLLKQCSLFLTELRLVCWPVDASTLELEKNDKQKYFDRVRSGLVSMDIRNTFPDQIFNHLPNLKKLSLGYYPFPFLSENIGNLTNLEELSLYRSCLICLPRTIGNLTKLTSFTPYTSYQFHYVPFEIKQCPLNDTTMSTRALYNNYKNKMEFPPLPCYPNNKSIKSPNDLKQYLSNMNISELSVLPNMLIEVIIDEYLPTTYCSNCKCVMLIGNIYYIWSHEKIGTDQCGVLARMCSVQCIKNGINGYKHFIASTAKNSKSSIENDDEAVFVNIGQKYFGKHIKKWKKFWKYNLKIEFDSFQLMQNTTTYEINVKFIMNH